MDEGKATYISVVQWVRQYDRPASTNGLASLVLSDGDRALVALLDGDDSDGASEYFGVGVVYAVIGEEGTSAKGSHLIEQACTHRTVKLPGFVLSFGSQVQAISLRDLATVGQEW